MSGVETPLEFAEKISQSLNLKPEEVDELFNIDESKDGYFVASLYPKKFLNKEQFKMMCALVKDLGGESYLQGAKSWKIAGPMAKKSPTTLPKDLPTGVSTAVPSTVSTEISQSSELHISALSEDEDVQGLRGSQKKVGSLYPVLVSSSGEVIDGFHRLAANSNWPKFTVEGITDPLQLARARLIANERRNVSPEEKAQLLREIYVYSKWSPKQMAEELGWDIRTVYRYLPDDLKERPGIGGPNPVDSLSTQDGKPVSTETLKPQDITYGKAREVLDTPAGREVLIDAVKEAMDKGEIPASLDKEEPLYAESIEIAEGEHEPIEDSENKGVGSSEPKKRVFQRHAIAPMPSGAFDVIYADPPWDYDVKFLKSSPNNHYATLAVEDIAGMTIPASQNAILFLWTTNPFLDKALKIMEGWGFTYKTNMVWVKPHIGLGFYFRGQHELLLVGVKGDVHPPEESQRFSSVLQAETGEHSAKPTRVYEILEQMYPNAKYLELFARGNKREKWTSWGDEK